MDGVVGMAILVNYQKSKHRPAARGFAARRQRSGSTAAWLW